MTKHYVYILKNEKVGRRYKGMTQDLDGRLKEHNRGKTKSTKEEKGWEIEYFEIFNTREKARAREKYFKTAAGRRWIKKKLGPIVQRIE
ncbi:MAG: GIY-YIG nuclease family protein [Saprospiraceae bacterium]|nr:GIY-YIG nuclease family protein [Saprospiraceae bacterium]